MGVGGQRHAPAGVLTGNKPVMWYVWWAPGSVWTGSEILTSTGIRFPDRPARSQSLNRLSYPSLLKSWSTFWNWDRWIPLESDVWRIDYFRVCLIWVRPCVIQPVFEHRKGLEIFLSQKCPDWLRDPRNRQFSGYGGFPTGVKLIGAWIWPLFPF